MRGLNPRRGIHLNRSLVTADGVSFVELIGWCSSVVQSQPPRVLVPGHLARDFAADQGQLLPVPGLGPRGRSHKMTFVAACVGLEGAWRGRAAKEASCH